MSRDDRGYDACLFFPVRQRFLFGSSSWWGWRLWLWRTQPAHWLMVSILVTSWSSKTTLTSQDWSAWTRSVDPTTTSETQSHLVLCLFVFHPSHIFNSSFPVVFMFELSCHGNNVSITAVLLLLTVWCQLLIMFLLFTGSALVSQPCQVATTKTCVA